MRLLTTGSAALDGDTLMYLFTPSGSDIASLYELGHVMLGAGAGQPAPLVSLPAELAGTAARPLAGPRLFAFTAEDVLCAGYNLCNYSLAWDRVLKELVLLSPASTTALDLSGNSLMVGPNPTQSGGVTIYDTASFPP